MFIGLKEIAGYYMNLAHGLREAGYIVTTVGGSAHPYKYSISTERDILVKLYEYSARKYYTMTRRKLVKKTLLLIVFQVVKFLLFTWAIIKNDIFIFSFGNSFCSNSWDLFIFKLLGKRVISNIAHGSEARPPYIDGSYQTKDGTSLFSIEIFKKYANKMERNIRTIERWSDVILCWSGNCHFLKRKFVNSFYIGIPWSFEDSWDLKINTCSSVRILHCPSHPAAKGSFKIRSAIEDLKCKGYDIVFIEIINRPHAEVLNELRKCDFVVDQLYSDSPMAGFATEAAWFCKPAVVGGYGWNVLLSHIPKEIIPPSEICHPDEIENAIEKLIINKEYRQSLGKKANEFVRSNWSRNKVSQKFICLITGNIPEHWYNNPEEIEYLYGSGLPENQIKIIVGKIVHKYGVKALRLSHRPKLEKAFLKFADI